MVSFGNNFNGIPILNELEFELLAADTPGSRIVNPHELGRRVIHENPNLKEVLSQDIFHWIEYYARQIDMEQDEISEFAEGIDAGYSFFIGVITNIRFLRSDYDDVYEFIRLTLDSGDSIPLVGERELDRIEKVRLGVAVIDQDVKTEYVGDSSDLASSHASVYLINSKAFRELLEIEFSGIEQAFVDKFPRILYENEELRWHEIERLASARITGFEHGIDTAVEMYLQVDQERLIVQLESLDSGSDK
jgi:hypothetical protein